MATLSHSDSRRLYSWWWDSHVPKNSKWLQDNLTDMDAKVKAMIKLIEEDADSFARRAEMYYKKRPELMKLVEEFYRAYRALAERYDHMTGELRHTQRTIAAAFPNQLPFVLDEDALARSSGPDAESHTPDVSRFLRALLGQEGNGSSTDTGEFDETTDGKDAEFQRLQAEALNLSSENENLKAMALLESGRAVKAESEIQELNKTLNDVQAEKDRVFLQYQICLDKLSNMEADLDRAEKDSVGLGEQKLRAETEVQTIKQALADLEVEKEAALAKQLESTTMIADLEGLVSRAKTNLEGLATKVVNIETESRYLTDEISVLVSEKEAGVRAYEVCQEKIAYLEGQIPLAEENAEVFKEKAESAENEVNRIKRSLAVLTVEKECTDLQYKNCVKRISALEGELSRSREDVKKLNTELQIEAMKRKNSEEKCILLEISKQSLRKEADDLAKKITLRDEELSRNHEELERLEASLQNEHARYTQIEAKLQALQIIRSQAQEDHIALAKELETGVQTLKDMEIRKRELENEVQRVKDENHNLQEEKVSSATSIKNLQNEVFYLKMMKTRLEEEVIQQTGQTSSLEQEISSLVKEISGLNRRYQALVEKLESVGLNPDTVETYIKNLRDENSSLGRINETEGNEKRALFKKVEHMEEVSKKNNVLLENSLSQLHVQLEESRKDVRETEETNQSLLGEKSALFAEKAALLAQLHTVTENLQKALGNNAVLENSLSDAKIELAGLREKSKGFEEICHLLKNEKSDLLTQRENLVVQLENVERRMEYTEHKYAGLEERYADLEKVNRYLQSEIQELTLSLSLEKQERTNAAHRHETLLVSAEQHIHLLQEENRWTMKEYEDELDKAGRVQIELFVMQKFIQDMETKNSSLLSECRKYVEASKLAEKLISELERENLEQEVEAELFIDEIEKLRLGIYRIFKVLEADYGHAFHEKVANEQNFVHHIIRSIEEMKHSIMTYKDEKQLLQVENSVLSTLLGQMASEGTQTKSKNGLLEQRLNKTTEKLVKVQKDKDSLLEINKILESQLVESNEKTSLLQVDMDSVSTKHRDVEKAYLDLLENHFQLLDENRCLLLERSELDAENAFLDGENDDLLLEALALETFTTVLESCANEKALESSKAYESLYDVTRTKDELETDRKVLKEKLESKQEENVFLEDVVQKFEMEVLGVKDALRKREDELVEADWNFQAEEEINIELANNLVALKAKFQELSLAKSEDKRIQQNEIEGLKKVNANLVSELSNLRAELDAKDVEFELWESEAAAFYFDFQVSSIQRVFYESKVHELTEVCENLEDQTVSRSREIEEMKGKFSSMESEIGELKAELSAYAPVITSLRDDVTSLEHNAVLHIKLRAPDDSSPRALKDTGANFHATPTDDQKTVQAGIQDLRKLQFRIKAVEKTMAEDIKKQGIVMKNKMKELNVHSKINEKKELGINVKSPDTRRESIAFRKGSSMKDILLDQISEPPSHRLRRRANSAMDRVDDKVLELWQIAEDNNGLHRPASFRKIPPFVASMTRKIEHPSSVIDVEKEVGIDQEANNKKILERLASDARKLTNLQLTVESLTKKLDANKKHRKAKDVDLDTVKEQLQEVEETVYQLVELNGKLMGNFEGSSSPFLEKRSASVIKRNKVSEQARKGSEKIGRLQVEVQKIEYILLKLEEEKKSKMKSRFIKNRTTIVLRDFIYNGRKISGKKKKKSKSRLCGCFRSSSSSNREENQM